MATVIPPDEVFLNPPRPLVESQGAYSIPDFVDLSYSQEEGMTANYLNHPFPRKGLIYPEAAEANNWVKKVSVMLLKSLSSPKNFPYEFARLSDYALRNHYLQVRFYCKFSREMWKLTHLFLRRLGISDDVSYRLGRVVATQFQFEELYRMILQDIFAETSKQALLQNPRKELNRLFPIYLNREKHLEGNQSVAGKFKALVRVLSVLLLVPRVKRAWRFALREMDIDNLRPDDADIYYSNMVLDYDFGGLPINERFAKSVDLFNWHQINLFKKQCLQKNALFNTPR